MTTSRRVFVLGRTTPGTSCEDADVDEIIATFDTQFAAFSERRRLNKLRAVAVERRAAELVGTEGMVYSRSGFVARWCKLDDKQARERANGQIPVLWIQSFEPGVVYVDDAEMFKRKYE